MFFIGRSTDQMKMLVSSEDETQCLPEGENLRAVGRAVWADHRPEILI